MTGTTVLAELNRIYTAAGSLTPAAVVADATPEGSPLHHHFEWDDATAAHAHRLTQAAALIRSIKVERTVPGEREPVMVRRYLSVPGTDEEDSASWTYVEVDDLSQRALVVIAAQMESDFAALRRKYRLHSALLADLIKREMGGETA